jgi:acetyl-CoA carboxylase biotin carboxyl carrier protein
VAARKKASKRRKAGKSTKATKAVKAVSKSVARSARPASPTRPVTKAAVAARKVSRKAPRKKATARKSAPVAGRGFSEIADLAGLMEEHGLMEVEFERSKDGATRIHVKRAVAGMAGVAAPAPAAVLAVAPAATPAPDAEAVTQIADDLHAFKSPMVGTFYRAPSPEASPFASIGDTVEASSAVCIIEAMKVMNEITPDISGEVVSIEVENGEAVEFGQTLMLIRTR